MPQCVVSFFPALKPILLCELLERIHDSCPNNECWSGLRNWVLLSLLSPMYFSYNNVLSEIHYWVYINKQFSLIISLMMLIWMYAPGTGVIADTAALVAWWVAVPGWWVMSDTWLVSSCTWLVISCTWLVIMTSCTWLVINLACSAKSVWLWEPAGYFC